MRPDNTSVIACSKQVIFDVVFEGTFDINNLCDSIEMEIIIAI
jgi:hypothetical protein